MEKLLTIEELAEKLGISKSHLRSLVFRKQIPYIKLSYKTIRFDPAEIEIWLKKRTISKENFSEKSEKTFSKTKNSTKSSYDTKHQNISKVNIGI